MGNAPYKIFHDPDMPVDVSGEKGLKYKVIKKKENEMTGWDRVKAVFESDIYGETSPELTQCKDIILITGVVGAGIGGVGRSRIAYMEFFRSHAHTAFETPLKAKAKLQDTVMLGFGSGAFRIGWRVAVFSAIYTLTTTCFTAYRGKSTVFDPALGGAVAGFIYKVKEGPKLMLAGTVLGGIFGLIGGGVREIAFSLAGVSHDDVILHNREKILQEREAAFQKLHPKSPVMDQQNRIDFKDLHTEILVEASQNRAAADNSQTPRHSPP